MPAPLLTGVALALCVLGVAGNAVFYLTDPNFPPVPTDSPYTPVLTLAGVYAFLAFLAWSQRGSRAAVAVVVAAAALALAFLVLGRGRDWHGSLTVPNYYNQVMRLGSIVGGVCQIGCAALAGLVVLVLRLRSGPAGAARVT